MTMSPPPAGSGPLSIVSIKAEYPEAFLAGDRYQVVCTLNRPLTKYEDRFLHDEEFNFPKFEARSRRFALEIDANDFDLERTSRFLQEVSARASELEAQATQERRRIKDVLREKSFDL